jgi:hypothetical protein
MKTMIFWKYSFQKLTEFSQGNNVVNAAPANINGFLWGDTCVSSNQLSRPIWSKIFFLHLENADLQDVFLSKTNSPVTWKQYTVSCSFQHGWCFFGEIHVFLQLS